MRLRNLFRSARHRSGGLPSLVQNLLAAYEGASTADSSGNGLDLTNVNGVTFDVNGMNFLRASTQSLQHNDAAGYTPTYNMTICLNDVILASDNNYTLLAKWATNNREYLIDYVTSGTKFRGFASTNGTTSANAQSGAVSLATPYNIRFEFDRLLAKVRIAIDNGTPVETTFAGPIFNSTGKFILGTQELAPSAFNGSMKSARVWGRLLSLTERAAIDDGVSMPFPEDLSAYRPAGFTPINSLDVVAPYLGQIANNCLINTLAAAAATYESFSVHLVEADITDLRVQVANWYVNTSGVETTGGDADYEITVEYPLNTTPQAVAFSADTTPTITGLTTATSDNTTIALTKGTYVGIHIRRTSATASITSAIGSCNTAMNELMRSGGSNQVGIAGPPTSGAIVTDKIMTPYALLGTTTKRSVYFVCCDSRAVGSGGAEAHDAFVGTSIDRGYPRMVGPFLGYTMAGIQGTTVAQFNTGTNADLRIAEAAHYTDVVINAGVNDITLGGTAAAVFAAQKTAALKFAGNVVRVLTVSPKTTTSDQATTLAGQTYSSQSAVITGLNNLIRTAPAEFTGGYIEIADLTEDSHDLGLWKVDGAPYKFSSNDGNSTLLHESTDMNLLLLENQVLVTGPT